VRNPNRIHGGLVIYKDEMNGSVYGTEEEREYARILGDKNLVNSDIPGDWHGRKWRSTFYKLGFISYQKYKVGGNSISHQRFSEIFSDFDFNGNNYEITNAGKQYVDSTTISERNDLILRQLLALEIPSPIESDFDRQVGQMKPFLFFLNILFLLFENNEPGLNALEIGLFIQPFKNHTADSINNTYQSIIAYREERSRVNGGANRLKDFDNQKKNEIRHSLDIVSPSEDTQFKEYPDTTIRYSRLSGLITNHGRRITVRSDKINLISQIIDSPLTFLSRDEPILYLSNFLNGTQTIPSDDINIARAEILELENELNNSSEEFHIQLPEDLEAITDESRIEQLRFELLERNTVRREVEFANNQSDASQIDEIIQYLRALPNRQERIELGINSEAPAYMEWSVWRAFLAINSIVNPILDTRGFKIDDEIKPIHHAPGGRADMSFQFDSWGLAAEVTLTGGSRQVVTEGEPVRRHIYQFSRECEGECFGLFIAPTIDINTAHYYLSPSWYAEQDADAEAYYLRIVPIKLQQFIQVLIKFKDSPFSTDDLKNLFNSIIDERDGTNHAGRWLRGINNLINRFVS